MKKLRHIYKHFLLVYTKKQIFFSLIFSLILSLPLSTKEKFLENIGSFFNGLLVIEIAYIAIFYSGTKGTERAKQLILDKSKNFNYYHYLLIKNYFSILIKFFILLLAYVITAYNISNIGFKYILLGIVLHFELYNLIQMFTICGILTTVDLILSMYFFLWGN